MEDLVGQILREVRMAGYKYINDDIPASSSHNPIKLQKELVLAQAVIKLKLFMVELNMIKIQRRRSV